MKTRVAQAILSLLTLISISFLLYLSVSRQNLITELEPRAKKYDEICNGVRWALHTDMGLLHDTDDPPRLTSKQVEDERRHLYERVGNTIGGDDSYVMLERCMPHPFPLDAWRACSSDPCLRTVLQQAMDSIPELP